MIHYVHYWWSGFATKRGEVFLVPERFDGTTGCDGGGEVIQIVLCVLGFVVVLHLVVAPPLLKPWWGFKRPPEHKNSRWFT